MPRRGGCYVTAEALYHLLGGKSAGYVPMVLNHEGGTHWYLEHRGSATTILDPTEWQFAGTPDYSKGRGCGFLTKKPSKRAQALMDKLIWTDPA